VVSSVVVFSQRSRLMKELPPEVLTSDHVAFVRSQKRVVLSPDEFDSICSGLRALESSSDRATFDQHVEDLHGRFESRTHCPKCGGNLIQRQSRTPGDERNLFLGCSNFPSCRYVRNLDTT
jgi:restriction system protein